MIQDDVANVLLVDDQSTSLTALEATLEGLAVRVVQATSGEEALCRLFEEDYAVVLLDVQATRLDDFETAQVIRGRERSCNTPIIFLTTSESPALTVARVYTLGAVDYLIKPVAPAVLRAKVAVFVDLFRKTRQLERQAEQVREAGRRKDEFLAMLAHELRNPLSPILTGLHILRRPGTQGKALEDVRSMIERQVRHLARLVDDLLDVSRIARGMIRIQSERLDLARLVRTTTEDSRPALERVGLALTVEAPETPLWILGDATRLAQVLSNLLDNAVKFSDRGGQVTVRLTPAADQDQAVLTVRDTGIGLEPDLLPHLFTSFAQADRSLERTRGGLGLGLALVKGLIDLHGGEVSAQSEGPGSGTEFTVRLPLADEPAALMGLPGTPAPAADRRRILIVEDHPDAAESLRLLLTILGHEVQVADTGPAGVQRAEEWQPDVVLCDIGLPGLDGYGVAEHLRRNPATATSRLIAITGYGQDEDRRRSQRAGFDHHLTKPVDPEVLVNLLAG
jgi:signal transduction histidine kinase